MNRGMFDVGEFLHRWTFEIDVMDSGLRSDIENVAENENSRNERKKNPF